MMDMKHKQFRDVMVASGVSFGTGNAPELRCYAEAADPERAMLLGMGGLRHILELDESY